MKNHTTYKHPLATDLLIKNISIINPETPYEGIFDVWIQGGLIKSICNTGSLPKTENPATRIIDGMNLHLCPGFVDLHSHLRDPGYTHKETLQTGGAAALAGGFTTICAVANTQPVLDEPSLIKDIILRSQSLGGPDIKPFAALSKGLQGREAAPWEALLEAGAISFSDDGMFLENTKILKKALSFSKSHPVRIALHEELPAADEKSNYREIDAIERDLRILKETGGKLHFMHVSTEESCHLIQDAKDRDLDVTCEVTPHHLLLTEKDAIHPNAKCNPPLRSEKDRAYLCKALQDGIIDIVATDHAPHSPSEKNRLYNDAPNGILGFQTALSVLLELVHSGILSLNRAIESITTSPAKAFFMAGKGVIQEGLPADLVICNLYGDYVFAEDHILSLSKNSPFIGRAFKGGVKATIHEGHIKYLSTLL